MEMKENIYPKLPTAPPIEDQGQGYRLQKINGDCSTRCHSDRRSSAFYRIS